MHLGSRRRMWYRAWWWSGLMCCLLVLALLPAPCSSDRAGGHSGDGTGKRHSDDSTSSGEEKEGLQAPASEVHLPPLSKTRVVGDDDETASKPDERGAPEARSKNRFEPMPATRTVQTASSDTPNEQARKLERKEGEMTSTVDDVAAEQRAVDEAGGDGVLPPAKGDSDPDATSDATGTRAPEKATGDETQAPPPESAPRELTEEEEKRQVYFYFCVPFIYPVLFLLMLLSLQRGPKVTKKCKSI
uniref:Uncharacterized protein n=1 Tax=Amblyomma maculatum TaxID=34609 RepID=G3MKD6_AMBMU